MPDDPEATSWTDLRASFDFTPAEEQEIAERADVLLAASEAQGWEQRSCAGGGEVTVPNTSGTEPHVCSGCRFVPCSTCPYLLDDQHQEPTDG